MAVERDLHPPPLPLQTRDFLFIY